MGRKERKQARNLPPALRGITAEELRIAVDGAIAELPCLCQPEGDIYHTAEEYAEMKKQIAGWHKHKSWEGK